VGEEVYGVGAAAKAPRDIAVVKANRQNKNVVEREMLGQLERVTEFALEVATLTRARRDRQAIKKSLESIARSIARGQF
jgi:hypothetical protein